MRECLRVTRSPRLVIVVSASVVVVVVGGFLAGCTDGSRRPAMRSGEAVRPTAGGAVQRRAAHPRPTAPVAGTGPPWRVATTTVTFTDPSRPSRPRGASGGHPGRTLTTVVRSPVTAAGRPISGPQTLVVFAHGYAVETDTYHALLDELAAAGNVVAAPEFPGQSSALPGPPDEADIVNEPCDLEFVAHSIEASAPPGVPDAVAAGRVVFVGHSDGATVAAAAAYQNNSCPGPRPVAVVALSVRDIPIDLPAESPSPLLLAITGTADETNPQRNTEQLWNHVRSPAWLLTVDGGTHLGTFTTDPDRERVSMVIAAFIQRATVDPRIDIQRVAGGRLHLTIR